MGNTNLCFEGSRRQLQSQRSLQTVVTHRSNATVGEPVNVMPQRSKQAEQIYRKLTGERPLPYSIQQQLMRLTPIKMTLHSDQGVFLGQLKDGKPHGPGQVYFDNQNFLEAIFKAGEIECEDAIFIQGNGNYYRGGFKESAQAGKGLLRASGSEWRGRFSAGRMSGAGVLELPDGRVYKGQFKQGKMHGKGTLIDRNGDYYEGYFRDGKRNGIGFLKTNNYEYFGPFQNDMKQGKGTVMLPGDNKFEGWFQKNKLNGYGELHRKTGEVLKKKYQNEQISKLFL